MITEDASRRMLLVGGAGDMSLSVDVAVGALAEARARGLATWVTNQADTLAVTPTVGAEADAVSAVDHADPASAVAWARERVAAGERFDLVFGVREMAQVAVAEIASALGTAGNPPEAVRRVRTKDACRAALAAAGFPQPQVRLCAGLADAEEFLRASRGPWVVKPRDAMGSEGVRKVTGSVDLRAAVAELPDPAEFLVEQFVEGAEFSVEGVFLRGEPRILAVTAKEKAPPPYFVEIGHRLPADLAPTTRAEVEARVVAALRALELRFGLFHVELWLAPQGVVLGEVHVRIGGGWIHRMLPYVIPGLELYGLVYDDALGLAEPPPLTPVRAAASRYLTPPPGRLTAVEGWPAVVAHPAVLYAELAVTPGDVIRPLRNAEDRVGVVVVGAETPAQAGRLAAELADSVRFVVEPATDAALARREE